MQCGDTIAERFTIERLADEGGMGVVYRGTDVTTGQPVAIKVLHTRGADSASRFAREAAVLSELDHPGIVRHIAHGQTERGQLYLVMEWLDGVDLAKKLQKDGLTIDESVTLARAAAAALGAAHARGVVHRDVKPSNLLLCGGDVSQVKLLDFGVARVTQATITLSGITFGTPGYMAPEQARGDRLLDARADVFALGCVLFECLTGRLAFQGEHLMAILAKILLEEAPRVRELRPEVPRALDQLVARMLIKDPKKRPRDGHEVVAEIDALTSITGSTMAVSIPPPELSLTPGEQRLLCVVLAGAPTPAQSADTAQVLRAQNAQTMQSSLLGAEPPLDPSPRASSDHPPASDRPGTGRLDAERLDARAVLSAQTVERLREAAAQVDARIEGLADGSVIATLIGSRSATDLVAQAARCALAMRAHLPDVPIVVTTGRGVLAGKLPVGDAIDRAASLMRGAALAVEQGDGRVQLDDVTAGLLDARFEVVHTGEGIFLRRERDLPGARRTLLGRPTPCVGRNRELLTLEAIYAECVDESVARAVVVTAPAGIGKSRLCYEFVEKISHQVPSPELWVGRGDPLSAGSPFGLIARALRRSDGTLEGESADARRRRLRARVEKHVPPTEATRVSEFLGELVGVPFSDDDSVQLRAARQDAVLMGDQMRRAWEDFLDAECAARPVVLVLEDLHWGDLPSVKMVDSALRHLRERPFMVLALARPEVHDMFPNLWAERSAQEMRLGELSRRASEKLARHVLGPSSDDAIVKSLVDKAAGNAFYLEELLRAVSEGRGEELPETVLAMVQARLEALGAQARWVLRAASVFGEVFWRGGVQALLGGEAGGVDLAPALAELIEREVIVRRGSSRFAGEDEMGFQHALIREAAYAMLTEEDRVLGHKLAGEWLLRAGESDAMVLAEHFERGHEPARARTWFQRAAEQALEGNDLEAAIARAGRGLEGEPDPVGAGELHLIAAEAHRWRGEHAAAEDHASAALSLLPKSTPRWFMAVSEVALASGRLGRYERLLELVEPLCHPPAEPAARRAYLVAVCRAIVTLLYADRRAQAEKLTAQIDSVEGEISGKDPVVAAVLHRMRATPALASGDPSAYLSGMQGAAACFEMAGDLRSALNARGNSGHAMLKLGRHREAIDTLSEALISAERLGLPAVVALVKHNLGLALARSGEPERGHDAEKEAAELFAAQGDKRLEAASLVYLAEIDLDRGEAGSALASIERALSLAAGTAGLRAHALAVRADIRLREGDVGGARGDATEAFEILRELGAIEEGEALIRAVHAESLHRAGADDEAKEAIGLALEHVRGRASKIGDETLRESFLASVPENARIAALAAAWAQP